MKAVLQPLKQSALPSNVHGPPPELAEKMVVLFHDDSTFQPNEDQPTLWTEIVMRPKSKGRVESWSFILLMSTTGFCN